MSEQVTPEQESWPPPPLGGRPVVVNAEGPAPVGAPVRYPQAMPPPRVAAGRLWGAGAVCALVSAVAALVCVLLARSVAHVDVFGGRPLTGVQAVAGAAGVALAATLVLQVLVRTTRRPRRVFGWLMTAATAAAAGLPFTTSDGLRVQLSAGGTGLVVGLVVGVMMSSAAIPPVRYR